MISLLSRPLWRAFFLCIPLWIIFGNFLLAAMGSILLSFLVGMLLEIRRAHQRQRDRNAPPPPIP